MFIEFLKHHYWELIMLPGNILAVEAIVRQAAVNKGYKGIVSWCDHVANVVDFIGQIITGLIIKKQGDKQ